MTVDASLKKTQSPPDPATSEAIPSSKSLESGFDPGFDRGFFAIALHLNRLRLRNLQGLRDQHHGDLDQAQIACALMTVTVGAGLLRSEEALQRLRKDGLPDPALGSWPKRSQRIRELVASTGLPRETIRRKLHQMEALGMVERDSAGGWLWAMARAAETREAYHDELRQLLVGAAQLRDLLVAAEKLLGH